VHERISHTLTARGHAFEKAQIHDVLLDHQDAACTDALPLMHSTFALAKARMTSNPAAHRQSIADQTQAALPLRPAHLCSSKMATEYCIGKVVHQHMSQKFLSTYLGSEFTFFFIVCSSASFIFPLFVT